MKTSLFFYIFSLKSSCHLVKTSQKISLFSSCLTVQIFTRRWTFSSEKNVFIYPPPFPPWIFTQRFHNSHRSYLVKLNIIILCHKFPIFAELMCNPWLTCCCRRGNIKDDVNGNKSKKFFCLTIFWSPFQWKDVVFVSFSS